MIQLADGFSSKVPPSTHCQYSDICSERTEIFFLMLDEMGTGNCFNVENRWSGLEIIDMAVMIWLLQTEQIFAKWRPLRGHPSYSDVGDFMMATDLSC